MFHGNSEQMAEILKPVTMTLDFRTVDSSRRPFTNRGKLKAVQGSGRNSGRRPGPLTSKVSTSIDNSKKLVSESIMRDTTEISKWDVSRNELSVTASGMSPEPRKPQKLASFSQDWNPELQSKYSDH